MPETVAFLFSDLQGSTRMLGALGPDAYAQRLTTYRQVVEAAAAAEGGRVVDREGDGLFLSFPTAAAAMRTAHQAQIAIRGLPRPEGVSVAARMGIHAGEALRHGEGWVGLSVHRAARVASAAHGGQVLVSEAARALAADDMPPGLTLRDLGRQRLKDLERNERLYQLLAPQLATEFPPLRTLEATPNNLVQQPTSFVGRGDELAMVTRLLAENRLLTLTGVGGVGKSRLALQAAAATLEDHDDGVWLIELGPLTDPAGVIGLIASVLGIREENDAGASRRSPQDRLIEHLEQRELLLILDNCEHLLDEVGRLADLLLRFCPRVRMLATSREGLGIGGETAWRIPSLSLPATDASPAAVPTDAVRLFVERARAMAPDFELTAATTPAVARICHRLDGIALAIELAAARVRGLAIDELATRLDESFRLLTGGSRTALPRQQTLEAAIDWSYQLLSDAERTLLARLAVFSGGFTLEAAEEVCAGGNVDQSDVVDLLLQLVDKSLVTPLEGPSGPARYRLLETMRQFALTKLNQAGNAEAVRQRHRDRFLRLAGYVDDKLAGPRRAALLERLDTEEGNLRAALDWSLATHAGAEAAVLATAIAWGARSRGQYRRAADHFRIALERGGFENDREAEATLRGSLATTLYTAGETDAAELEAERARDLVADAAPSSAKVLTLTRYANLLRLSVARDPRDAIAPARAAVGTGRAVGDRRALAGALRSLGSALDWAGEGEEAIEHLREALAISRDLDDREAIVASYDSLAAAYFAGRHAEDSARLFREINTWLDSTADEVGWSLDLWGGIAYELLRAGDWPGAEAVLERIGRYHLEGYTLAMVHHIRASVRWMQGRLADAATDAAALRALKIPRWNHDLFPLEAEVAAARGSLDAVRAVAEEYLTGGVDASEESMKIAVLAPLVRAEVDVAMATTGNARSEHGQRAADAVARAEELMERHPPKARGSIQFERADVYLQLARAELSRVTEPDPALWRRIIDEAWFTYTSLYARWRLAEALSARGQTTDAASELGQARRQATELGASLVASELDGLRDRGIFEVRDTSHG